MKKYNRDKIIELRKKGLSIRAIQKELGISSTSLVHYYLHKDYPNWLEKLVILPERFPSKYGNQADKYMIAGFNEYRRILLAKLTTLGGGGIDMTKVIQPKAIHTTINRGKGTEKDPIRNVDQFFTLDGDFLFEYDPTTEEWYGLVNLLDWLLPHPSKGKGNKNMITFFIILIICAIIGFFICGNDGGYGFELEGAFLGIILGAFVGVIPAVIIAFIVGSRFPAHFVLIEKRNLVALQDNLSSSGRFFLGSGSVNEEQRYYYFYDLGNGGYKADYERADTSVVFEDEQKKPYLNKYTWLFVNPEHQKWGFTFNLRDSEFHIPKGSLLRNYQLDLK